MARKPESKVHAPPTSRRPHHTNLPLTRRHLLILQLPLPRTWLLLSLKNPNHNNGLLELILAAKPPLQFIPHKHIHESFFVFPILSMYIDSVPRAYPSPYRIRRLDVPGHLAPYRYVNIQQVQPLTPLANSHRTASFKSYTAQEPVLGYEQDGI